MTAGEVAVVEASEVGVEVSVAVAVAVGVAVAQGVVDASEEEGWLE